jgi:hypothetical protein
MSILLSGLPLEEYAKLTISQILSMEESFQWITENFVMENWLVDHLNVDGTIYYGPKKMLSNLNGEEFPWIDHLFNEFTATKSDETLLKFIAAMYRERSKNGNDKVDLREEFYEDDIPVRADKFKNIDRNQAYSIYLNYIGVRGLMEERNPNLFSTSSGGRKKGWESVYTNLSRSGIGSMNEVIKMSIWNILSIIENDILDSLEEKNERKHNN